MTKLPDNVLNAIKSGPVPVLRGWRSLPANELTRAEKMMAFIEGYLKVPEGALVGKDIRLIPFQEAFIYAVYDNPHGTRQAYLSIARKNGKSAVISGLMCGHTIGPEADKNSQIISGANSREQAGVIYSQSEKMMSLNPDLNGLYRLVPSSKRIFGLSKNVEFRASSAEAKTAHGSSGKLIICDEVGQIVGPTSPYIEALTTSQGAHEDPLLIAISTSAAADADMFSIWCDDAERSDDPHTVCHVYKADEDCDLLDESQWIKANPALGHFRNKKDLEEQLKKAVRIPSQENSARNLLLNNRVALESAWLAPAVWKANSGMPDWDVFRKNGVSVGLDLSQKRDLTVCCISAMDDDGIIHVYPFAFTPLDGIADRSKRDRSPYDQWARDGIITAVPGNTIDYDWVAQFIKLHILDEDIEIRSINFDRWRIAEFRAACERNGVELMDEQWFEVGQGFKDQSVRIEAMETALLQNKILHGAHAVLNLGAASAIIVKNPVGDSKIDKTKCSQKVDGMIAMLQAIYPLISQTDPQLGEDLGWMIG